MNITRCLLPALVPGALFLACGAAFAQSSISLSGLIDLNVGKDVGASQRRMGTGNMSHLQIAGTEDLGGGMQAIFKLSSRINADDGSTNTAGAFLNSPAGTFWSQQSWVGLNGGFGTVKLGRQFSAALLTQALVDPWFLDHVTINFMPSTGGIANFWYNDAVTYEYGAGGFSFAAQAAQKDNNPGWAGTPNKMPWSVAFGYAQGPWQLRFAHEKPSDGRSHLSTLFGGYDFGVATFNAMVASGKDHTDAKVRTWAVSSVVPLGAGQFRASLGQYKQGDAVLSQKLSVGYHYFLSKRTSIYTTFAHDNKAPAYKNGYEFGVQHAF